MDLSGFFVWFSFFVLYVGGLFCLGFFLVQLPTIYIKNTLKCRNINQYRLITS